MANLIPFKKSNNPIVKADKFLPRIKPLSVDSKKETPKLLVDSPLLKIERKVIKIDKLLKDSLLLSKKENEKGRVQKEEKKFEEREKELEKKKPKPVAGTKIPSLPGVGILGWIKNFIVQTVLGFLAVRLIDYLPKLLSVLPAIIKVTDFITDIGGKMLDGLITFVDKAYDLVDNTRKFAKTIGGDGLAQTFDKFTGALGTMLDIAVIAAISAASQGGDGGGGGPGGGRPRKGFDTAGRRVGVDAQKRYAQRFGKDQFLKRFGKRNLINLGEKGASKSILRFVRPLLKRIPIPVIGALIDFGLSWALGEDPGRAAFRAIGAGLLGWVGTALGGGIGLAGGPLAFVGAALGGVAGGTLGDMAGGALYDLFFGGKKKQGKVAKAAGGGKPSTRGGKLVGGPAKRTLKKKKTPRTLRATPSKLKPGGSVGGEKKIKELYPESKDKTKMNPFEFLKKSYETFSKSTGLGALVALAIKPLMGDKPSYADYKSVGVGINNWMNSSVGSGTLAYAGGGEVKMESIISGEDYSDVIAKSVQDSVAPQVDRTIQDLMKQLMLKQPTKEPDKTDPTIPTDEELSPGGLTKGQWGPLLDLIAGKESGGNYEAMYPSTTLPGATKMIIAEVARRATGAVGKYQQLPQYLVGRAKAAGLNPDKDLYSPENQEKIIINVNIRGRGGDKWLKGEISDEQFMQGLSQEFASLPNAQGQFYYPGQRSAMTPEKVKAALSKVKKGGYSQQELASSESGAGTLGSKQGNLDVAQKIAQSMGLTMTSGTRGPRYPGDNSLHIQGRARDFSNDSVGNGTPQQLAYAKKMASDYGSSLTQLIYTPLGYGIANGKKVPLSYWGEATNAQHYHHVHVAYEKGGKTKGTPHFAMLGEKGREFVIDADSTAALESTYPGFLDALNRAKYKEAVKVLQNYTHYEQPYGEPEIVYVPIEVPVPMPMGGGGSSMIVGGGGDNYVNSNMEQTLAQIG